MELKIRDKLHKTTCYNHIMKLINKTVQREYEVLERYEAGIILTGPEVKSIKTGRVTLEGSFVKLRDGSAYLFSCDIPLYAYARVASYDSKRIRKLLLRKDELLRIKTKLAKGGNLTIIPLACYTTHGVIKLEIGLCKGKKLWQRKKIEKERDVKRIREKEMKEYLKR